jgi:carbonic anhydrase
MDPLPDTPEDAIEMALAGNRRFVEGQSTAFREDMDLLHARTANHQHPFVAILACADSRVPVGLVLDEHIGRVFVTRIAGNTASTEVIASLEYAVAVLGVKAIIVMGHTNCGAIKAAIRNDDVPGQISALFAGMLPAISECGGADADPDEVTQRHARNQVDVLTHASTVLGSRVKDGALKVVPALYDVATGEVSLLR